MANVIRDGTERQIDLEEIVRDDLLVLRPGDQVVVDGIAVSDGRVSLDESFLTGESEQVPKTKGDTLFSGSFCMTGAAVYQATAIGAESMAQQLSSQARKFRNVRTPLQTEMTWLMRFLLIVLLLMSLQVLNTINQLVESMSHVDMLCLDKTGTITTNNLRLEAVIPVGTDEQAVREALGDLVASLIWFERHGSVAVLICRMIPGLRSLISFPAGISHMPLLRFSFYTVLGSASWNGALVGLGWLLRGQWETVGGYVQVMNVVVFGLLLGAAIILLWRCRSRNKAVNSILAKDG